MPLTLEYPVELEDEVFAQEAEAEDPQPAPAPKQEPESNDYREVRAQEWAAYVAKKLAEKRGE